MFHNSKCLWFTYYVAVGMILVNFAVTTTITRSEMDEETLATQIELDEYDFEDLCTSQLVSNEWSNTLANRNLLSEVSESLAASQREKAIEDYSGHTAGEYSKRAADIARKLELISKPGDLVLPEDDYRHLVTFSDRLRAGANKSVICEPSLDSLNETSENSSAPNQTSCESDRNTYLRQEYALLLKLVPKAAHLNGFDDVESYWLTLSELPENGYERAKTLWAEVKPLYQKLSRWISDSIDKKCKSKNEPNTRIPDCDSLLSMEWRFSQDWTNLAALVLPKECKDTFHKLQASLEDSKLTGKLLFEKTEKMSNILEIGKLPPTFFKFSAFNQSCPARYLDACNGEFRVASCGNSSWPNYLDAHELSIRAIRSHLSHSNDALSYLLKNGNRFSALTEGVVGLGPIIASNRHYLSQQGIIKDAPCLQDSLATLLALRIIPKMSFYLRADLARMEAIESNGTVDTLTAWRSLQNKDDSTGAVEDLEELEELEELESLQDWWDLLHQDLIAANQPYISKFYGLFIQFQLFEQLLKSDESVSNNDEEFIRSSQQIRALLTLGKSKKWPELLEDSFQISELTSEPLLRFFNRFDTFISPFIVPKDTKKIQPPLPTTDIHSKKTALEEVPAQRNVSTSSTILPRKHEKEETTGTEDNETGEAVEEPAENTHYIIGAVIACIVVGTIAIVVVAYKWHLTKRRQYQRPTDQPA